MKTMKKILIAVMAVVLALGCVFAFAACNKKGDKETLTLATNAQFAPYEYKIGSKYYGIDMEIAKIIAEELDMELVISDMDFDAVVTSVQQGDADIALACLTVNAKRAQSVTFSEAYEEGAAQVLIVKKSDTSFDSCTTAAEINSVFSAKSGTVSIGAQAGTTGEAYIEGDADWGFAGIPNSSVSSYQTIGLAVDDIKNGNISYAVVDKATANTLVTANPNEIKMIAVDLTIEKYAIGVSKDKPELLAKINEVIKKIKADGTLDAIYAAYDGIDISDDEATASAPKSEVYVGVNG